MFAARQVAQMFGADAGQAGDFFLCEDFLTRLDGDHYLPSISLRSVRPLGLLGVLLPFSLRQKPKPWYKRTKFRSNSPSVSFAKDFDDRTNLQMIRIKWVRRKSK